MGKSSKIDVSIHLKANRGESPPAWIRLWRRLISNRKANLPATREDAGNGKMSNGNDTNVPNF